MRTTNGEEINRETAAHKFGGDPMAEYLYGLLAEDSADESDGDASEYLSYFARFGHRILHVDGYGNVYVDRCSSEDVARLRFTSMADEYSQWLELSEEGEDLVLT